MKKNLIIAAVVSGLLLSIGAVGFADSLPVLTLQQKDFHSGKLTPEALKKVDEFADLANESKKAVDVSIPKHKSWDRDGDAVQAELKNKGVTVDHIEKVKGMDVLSISEDMK